MLAYLAILMPVLVLCCGIAVDVGLLQMHRLQMQSACDAAALGAELELERGTGNWVTAAQGDAADNGFTNGSGSTTVTAAMRPTTGAYAGFYDAVQTTISQTQSTLFLKLLGNNLTTLKTRSVAVMTPCVYLTNSTGITTKQLSSVSGTITSTCPYYINNAASVDSATTFSGAGENITGPAGSSTWAPATATPPRYGAATQTDPLSGIPQPVASSCAVSDYSIANTSAAAGPGTYCGTLTITNSSISLYPGLYVIAGSLVIKQNSVLTGSGVTFYFTADSSGNYGKLSVSDSTMNLTAPTSSSDGGIPGVLVMTNRNWNKTSAQDFVLSNSIYNADGIWYLTGAGLSLTSGSAIKPTNYAGLLADNLVINNSTFKTASNFSNVQGGNPFRPLGGLVE